MLARLRDSLILMPLSATRPFLLVLDELEDEEAVNAKRSKTLGQVQRHLCLGRTERLMQRKGRVPAQYCYHVANLRRSLGSLYVIKKT